MERVLGHSESNKFLTERSGGMRRRFFGALGTIGLAFLSLACGGMPDSVYVSAWTTKIKDKLQNPSQLTPEEKFYPKVRVVAAGETLAERLAMQKEKTPVNVRNYPATEFDNGNRTPIIGKIAQGGEVINVILTRGIQPNSPVSGFWGAFNCSDTKAITWESGKSPKPGEICTIYGDYLMADGSIDFGNGIIGPSVADQQASNR